MTLFFIVTFFLGLRFLLYLASYSQKKKKKIHNLLAHAALSYEHTIETPTWLNVHLPVSDGDRVSDLMCYHHFIEVLSI
jgi:hypothetical protein